MIVIRDLPVNHIIDKSMPNNFYPHDVTLVQVLGMACVSVFVYVSFTRWYFIKMAAQIKLACKLFSAYSTLFQGNWVYLQ